MPGVKEIKKRIKSVSDTQKITNAMYLVASAKLSAAKGAVSFHRDYSEYAGDMLVAALSQPGGGTVFTEKRVGGINAVLVLGSERGLCSDYNKNIVKYVTSVIKEYKNPVLYISGSRVSSLLKAVDFPIDESFNIPLKKPDPETSSAITDYFVSLYRENKISTFDIIYADFNDRAKIKTAGILPVIVPRQTVRSDYEIIPDRGTLLDTLIPVYLGSAVRSCVLSAFCSEQSIRMAAMKNANDNAGDLLDELRLEYNHTRQNAITGELTEISGERNVI